MSHPLKICRDERNLTQVELGKLLGTDGLTVSRWERGLNLPRKRQRDKIREVVGIAPEQLIAHLKMEEPEPETESAQ